VPAGIKRRISFYTCKKDIAEINGQNGKQNEEFFGSGSLGRTPEHRFDAR